MSEPTNAERAERAYLALLADQTDNCFGDRTRAADEIQSAPISAIADLLTNLRHYCDQHGLSFADADSLAHDGYTEEVVEERERKNRSARRGGR